MCHYHIVLYLWWNLVSRILRYLQRLATGLKSVQRELVISARFLFFVLYFFSFPNLVASMFTGFCCSLTFPLEREMSPHWKWSLSILSAHFFLIRWFVSLGNCIQLQTVYWNSRQQQTLSFCFKKKSSWIKYWQKRENKICTHREWTAHGWNSDHTKSLYTQGHWKD